MTPQELLGEDDRLLDQRQETLRLWEAETPFVVLGRSCRVEADVHVEACEADGVPILRRSSGGGTVVQAAGCLNFTCVLDLEARPALQNVSQSYCVILGWLKETLGVAGLAIAGSDLLYEGRKVSGNAQRRIPGWVLHHGTLLYGLDPALVTRYLREPPRQPEHRGGRTHGDFLGTLPLPAGELRKRLTVFSEMHSKRNCSFRLLS